MERYDLEGRVAVVTGGSDGIGAATALLLTRSGVDVVITGRNEAKLVAVASNIENETGRRCLSMSAEARDEKQMKRMIDRTVEELGRIDILVNNVGWALHHVPLSEIETSAWHEDFALNLDSALYCTQAAGAYFRAQASGAIVNVSSVAAEYGIKGLSAFSAAKAALEMLTRVSAGEWGPYGIRVNCVAPGIIATSNALEGARRSGLDLDAICAAKPLQRAGSPEEVANAIVFLASDAASYITGEVLSVRGGPSLG